MPRATDSRSIPAILPDCSRHPNCVSSQAHRAAQRVEPFPCRAGCRETFQQLRSILDSTPGVRIVESSESYLRAECVSRVLRFVDDLELLIDEDQKVVHVRSASRLGSWDFGVNRRRVEHLRRRSKQKQQ